jgi:two-component system, OmpR family, sensor kinase
MDGGSLDMIKSLRGRLFFGFTAIIVLTGAIAGVLAHRWAYGEAIEMQDSVLMQIGTFAMTTSLGKSQSVNGVDADAEIAIVELGAIPHGTPDDRRLWSLRDGLHNDTYSGQPVRVLVRTRADGDRFAVTQRTEIRSEIAGDMALRTLLPICALVPCLMLVTAVVIARSFAPMMRLADEVDRRGGGDIQELAVVDAPSELHPFLQSINGLLGRMRLMMERQQRFIADAAHELRTPITALSLQAENLDPVQMPVPARGRLNALKSGMARTTRLLEQLLTLARQEAEPPLARETMFLDKIVKEAVADLLPQAAARDIDLGFKTAEPISVDADGTAIGSAVRNLLENAIKFTPDGGRVDVSVRLEENWAVFQVEDTGPGIPSTDLERVFEPFYRGRSTIEGSGLGLSIVKRIVDRHSGTVRLTDIDESGRSGLSVTVKIPGGRQPG